MNERLHQFITANFISIQNVGNFQDPVRPCSKARKFRYIFLSWNNFSIQSNSLVNLACYAHFWRKTLAWCKEWKVFFGKEGHFTIKTNTTSPPEIWPSTFIHSTKQDHIRLFEYFKLFIIYSRSYCKSLISSFKLNLLSNNEKIIFIKNC